MRQKGSGVVRNAVERVVSGILDPKRKTMSSKERRMNGGVALRAAVVADLKQLGDRFDTDPVFAPARAPSPRSAASLVSAPAPYARHHSSPITPFLRFPWSPLIMQQLRASRWTAAGNQRGYGDVELETPAVTHKVGSVRAIPLTQREKGRFMGERTYRILRF